MTKQFDRRPLRAPTEAERSAESARAMAALLADLDAGAEYQRAKRLERACAGGE